MGFRDKLADFVYSLTGLSASTIEISTGSLIIGFLALIAGFICLLALVYIVSRRLRKPLQDPQIQLVAGLRGKLEKMEKTLNELNTERARAQQFYQLEFDYLKNELELLKQKSLAQADQELMIAKGQSRIDAEPDNSDTELKPLSAVKSEPQPVFDFGSGKSASDSEELDDLKKKSKLETDFLKIEDQPLHEPQLKVVKSPEQEADSQSESQAASLNVRLTKSRQGFFSKLKDLFSFAPKLDPETIEELEAILIASDLGPKTTEILIDELKSQVKLDKNLDQSALLSFLQTRIAEILSDVTLSTLEITAERQVDGPKIVMLVGVNGTGKTTSVAKLTRQWKNQGKKVLMVAADTFRAAAVDQLQVWADRLEVPIVAGAPDAKPATVVFDAMEKAKTEDFDVLVIDTAGRLHNKSNLMQELEGVKNIIKRHQPSAPHEVILVVDGTSGQNALLQAKEFNEATNLTGIIVTKLDGTAKGGIVVAIKNELGLPVRYIGVGESFNDLRPFKAEEFAEALFAA